MATLATHPCKSACRWDRAADGTTVEGEPLFTCASCASEWIPSERWTPVNADGTITESIKAARG